MKGGRERDEGREGRNERREGGREGGVNGTCTHTPIHVLMMECLTMCVHANVLGMCSCLLITHIIWLFGKMNFVVI